MISVEEFADPRLILFVIYGLFVIVLAFCTGTHLLCGGRCAFFPFRRQAVANETNDDDSLSFGVIYELLSSERKREIDRLRQNVFGRILKDFTLTLEKDHMLKMGPSEEPPNESPVSAVGEKDIEMGSACELGQNELGVSDGNIIEAEESSEYTHMSIPCPGVDINGKSVDGHSNTDGNKKREVPIFCAICLSEYEISDEICWSSNPKCTHAFHKECVLQWLVTLGRRGSKMQRFPDILSEKKLLKFDLECPCCRQEYVIKSGTKAKP